MGHHCVQTLEGSITQHIETQRGRDVTSPLALRSTQWKMLTSSAWVFKTVTRGYRLQFAVTPPRFSGILHSQARGESALILEREILSLLEKRAISIVPAQQSQGGFYSKYFLVPKRGRERNSANT
ncbi:hypothetical protein CgunFtcFv8_002188 [Champsocephalus gunnari]|uniref:Uncharacterized protein n=1 Tax=Champsocephalus gunnari TaxID=52237 RepID=A0AAN8H8T2_CHAGU|nr:hypothetical protein CgunFtcFv8_002188 [Champsocephalus gunnari]